MNKTSSNWIYKQPDLNLYRPTSLINIFPCGRQTLLYAWYQYLVVDTHTVKLNLRASNCSVSVI